MLTKRRCNPAPCHTSARVVLHAEMTRGCRRSQRLAFGSNLADIQSLTNPGIVDRLPEGIVLPAGAGSISVAVLPGAAVDFDPKTRSSAQRERKSSQTVPGAHAAPFAGQRPAFDVAARSSPTVFPSLRASARNASLSPKTPPGGHGVEAVRLVKTGGNVTLAAALDPLSTSRAYALTLTNGPAGGLAADPGQRDHPPRHDGNRRQARPASATGLPPHRRSDRRSDPDPARDPSQRGHRWHGRFSPRPRRQPRLRGQPQRRRRSASPPVLRRRLGRWGPSPTRGGSA